MALALLNLVLGYRSALADYLASPPMSHEGTLLGDPLQVETQDRKPKPTRQQLTSSSERTGRKDKSNPRPFPEELATRTTSSLPALPFPAPEKAYARAAAAWTRPSYLRACDTAFRDQLPPPA